MSFIEGLYFKSFPRLSSVNQYVPWIELVFRAPIVSLNIFLYCPSTLGIFVSSSILSYFSCRKSITIYILLLDLIRCFYWSTLFPVHVFTVLFFSRFIHPRTIAFFGVATVMVIVLTFFFILILVSKMGLWFGLWL
jgi:hypothetical protein